MHILSLLTLLIVHSNSSYIWYRGTSEIKMVLTKKHKIMIEEKCFKSKKCESYKIAVGKPIKLPSTFQPNLNGGRNPYSMICLEYLKLSILVLKDAAGNENSFCVLKDQSLIDSSGLARMYMY